MNFIIALTLTLGLFTYMSNASPIQIVFAILLVTTRISLRLGLGASAWLGLVILIIYLGGMIIVFSYFLVLIAKHKIGKPYYILILLPLVPIVSVQYGIIISTPLTAITIIHVQSAPILLFCISALLFTLPVVYFLTARNRGPIRDIILLD